MIHYRPRPRTTLIVLHDSHSPPEVVHAEAWLRWKGRQMGLLDIGYHALIEADGAVIATRDYASVGSHTPGYNHESIGVCLIGGCDHDGNPADTFTSAQRLALGGLTAELQETFGPLRLVGHSELPEYRRHKPCPALDMNALRTEIAPCPNPGA